MYSNNNTVSFTDLDWDSEMNILKAILITFEASFIFLAARIVANIGLSLKSNHHIQIQLA